MQRLILNVLFGVLMLGIHGTSFSELKVKIVSPSEGGDVTSDYADIMVEGVSSRDIQRVTAKI